MAMSCEERTRLEQGHFEAEGRTANGKFISLSQAVAAVVITEVLTRCRHLRAATIQLPYKAPGDLFRRNAGGRRAAAENLLGTRCGGCRTVPLGGTIPANSTMERLQRVSRFEFLSFHCQRLFRSSSISRYCLRSISPRA